MISSRIIHRSISLLLKRNAKWNAICHRIHLTYDTLRASIEFEIAFNLESIRRHKVRFNELFGRNAPILQSGEIAVFLHQAFKRNMTGRYFPLSLCSHPNPTTMEHMALNEGVIMAHGASIALIHPVTWFPRIIVNAYRRSRHLDTSFPQMLKLMLKGCIYRYRHISSDGSERR